MTPARLELGGATLPAETVNRSARENWTQGDRSFRSILFSDDANAAQAANTKAPDYFRDLNFDQLVDSITAGRDEYDLKPFFYVPLTNIDAIHDRQAVFHDLETPALFDRIQSFAGAMLQMRSCIANAEKFYYKYQKNALVLTAVEVYCSAVSKLTDDLSSAKPESLGFRGLRDYLAGYIESSDFRQVAGEADSLRAALRSIRYSLHIDGKRVTVGRYGDEPDFSAEVVRTFEKFRQGASKEYQFRISKGPDMNHVEAAILDRVARLYPDIFLRLEVFPQSHSGFLEPVIATFDREVQFYVAYIEFKRRVEKAGLPFCYPEATSSKDIHAHGTFDLALASKIEHFFAVYKDLETTQTEVLGWKDRDAARAVIQSSHKRFNKRCASK